MTHIIFFLFFFLFILPYALTDILGRLAQRLLVQDSNGHPICRQEPTRADKNRQEPSRGIFRLKYYLLDPIHRLYIKISHIIDFASPKNNVIAILYIPLLTDKKFFVT